MFVYFIQAVEGGPIKIGVSKRPDRKLSFLQPASPYPLTILGVGQGGRLAEASLLRRFAADRIGDGEWFSPSDGLSAFVAALPSWEAVLAGAECPEIAADDTYNHLLADLWKRGYTYDDIGSLLGVTRQRAFQVVRPFVGDFDGARPDRPAEQIEIAFERLLADGVA